VRDAGLVDAGRPGVVTYSRKVFIPLTRLCRDRCHYCTFVTVPHRLPAAFLERDEVLEIARAGAAAGCKEALFTLGDRPEERWPAAREWLEARGYHSTLEYVRACAIAVLEETGLLPHLNPGVMSWEELTRLKPVAPSMGMMLETTATRLWSEPGGPHFGSPDKEPAVRLRTLTDAGRVGVPFTTGILIGIGETGSSGPSRCSRSGRRRGPTGTSRRRSSRTSGRSRTRPWPTTRTPTWTTSPPRSPSPGWCSGRRCGCRPAEPRRRRVRAHAPRRHRRLGRRLAVTADHVNPERPWPAIDELAARSAEPGSRCASGSPAYPRYVLRARLDRHAAARARGRASPIPGTGLAREGAVPVGPAVAGAGRRVRLHRPGRPNASIDSTGRTRRPPRRLRVGLRRLGLAARAARRHAPGAPVRLDADVRAGLALATSDPAPCSTRRTRTPRWP
jgi:FO synthase